MDKSKTEYYNWKKEIKTPVIMHSDCEGTINSLIGAVNKMKQKLNDYEGILNKQIKEQQEL